MGKIALKVAPWLLLVLVGCGTPLPPRVAFAPRTGPPECTAKPTEDATAEWDKFHADAAKLGKALEFTESDPTLVYAHLRLAVRTLIDREGCMINFAVKPLAYSLACGKLSGDAEHYRSTLETGVREHVIDVVHDAEAYKAKCGYSPVVEPWTPASVLASVNGWTTDGTAKMIGGCGLDHADACERGCDNGNADACGTLVDYYAIKEKDPAAELNARTRECLTRIQTKDDPKMSSACFGPMSDYAKPGASRETGQKLVTGFCEAAPWDPMCSRYAMTASSPYYDKARAIRIAKIIDECQGPCKGKEILAMPGTPHYDAGQAHRSVEWMSALCDAGDARCEKFGTYLMNASTPFEKAARQKFLHTEEAACTASPTATSAPCQNIIAAYMWGSSTDAAKGLALAERMCAEPKKPACMFLAICHEKALCGVPKDLTKARRAFTRECAASMQETPTPTRESIAACGWSDGTRPLP